MFALVSPWVAKVAIYSDYIINYNYYANELCINKDKVELDCGGCCQVDENIQSVEEKENPATKQNKSTQVVNKEVDSIIENNKTSVNTYFFIQRLKWESRVVSTQLPHIDIVFSPPELYLV